MYGAVVRGIQLTAVVHEIGYKKNIMSTIICIAMITILQQQEG